MTRTAKGSPAGAVLVAYLHPNQISHCFSDSLMRLVAYDIGSKGRVIRSGGPVMFRCGPNGLVEARNAVVKHFLDNTKADWLWMIDSDMGFKPETVDRLVEAADPVARPVVGGLCFGLRETEPDGFGGWVVRPFPTLYDWAKNRAGTFGFRIRREYQPDTLTQVAGTGAACLLVHRSVLEKVQADSGTWFDPVKQSDGKLVSEDLSFCYRINTAGFPVFVHTGVQTVHHKQIWVGEDVFTLFEALYRAKPKGGEPAEEPLYEPGEEGPQCMT